MLTINEPNSAALRRRHASRPSPRRRPDPGRDGVGRRAPSAGRSARAGQHPAKVGHPDPPERRPLPPGHVRPEARGARRVPRRVPPHQDQRPGHGRLRADAAAGEGRGQVRHPARRPAGAPAHRQRVLQRLPLAGVAARLRAGRGAAARAGVGREPRARRQLGGPAVRQPEQPRRLGAGLLPRRRVRAVPRGWRELPRVAEQPQPLPGGQLASAWRTARICSTRSTPSAATSTARAPSMASTGFRPAPCK